jgi:hypothetical protein
MVSKLNVQMDWIRQLEFNNLAALPCASLFPLEGGGGPI